MKHEFTAILPGFHPDKDGVPQLWAVTEWREEITYANDEKGKSWPAGTVFAYRLTLEDMFHTGKADPKVKDWSAINGPGWSASHEEAVKKAYTLAHLEATAEAAKPANFVTLFRKKSGGAESFTSIPAEKAWFAEQGEQDGVCFEHAGGGIAAQYYWEDNFAFAGPTKHKTLWQGVKWLREKWAEGKAKKGVAAVAAAPVEKAKVVEKTKVVTELLSNDTPGHIFWKAGAAWWKDPGLGTTKNREESCIYTYEDFLQKKIPGVEFQPLVEVPTRKTTKATKSPNTFYWLDERGEIHVEGTGVYNSYDHYYWRWEDGGDHPIKGKMKPWPSGAVVVLFLCGEPEDRFWVVKGVGTGPEESYWHRDTRQEAWELFLQEQRRIKTAYKAARSATKPAAREEDSYSFSGDADFQRILQENPGKKFIICRVQHEKYRHDRLDKNGPAEAWLVIERRKGGDDTDYPNYHHYDTKEEALAGARKEKWTVFPGLV